jgi:D-beta-D-heptose 7-phosphate kinase / D-beta-D-heptose 1-phosphate adenosyltransferase
VTGTRPLVVVGDALLDRDVHGTVERLCPDAPAPVVDELRREARPGGAALAAALLARDGRAVRLVTALGRDRPGGELRAGLEGAGVEVVDLGLGGPTPEKIRIRSDGRSLVRLDRGGPRAAVGAPSAAARAAIGWAEGVLVSDYGRGVAAEPALRDALRRVASEVPLVWDPHPRGPAPTPGSAMATPNLAEVDRLVPGGAEPDELARRAEALARRWRADNVCVTVGERGAVLARPGRPPLAVPADRVEDGDPCGAGDRFASRVVSALAEGASAAEAVLQAVAVSSAFVAAGGAAAALGQLAVGGRARSSGAEPTSVPEVVAHVRARGGRVVATGGCFDLLHAGHVRTLEAARGLGDCLVVLLNSDASVRRLKGPGRPLVPQHDRAAVLSALACVDAVTIFGEDTPERALRELRPDVFAKGGDYAGLELPEAGALREWGGRVAVLPYLAGRSTSRLIEVLDDAG